MKKIFAIVMLIAISGCTRTGSATKILQDEGYSNITITGYRFFGCGKGDDFHTGFTATGPTGHTINGVVCSGWFKGSTVRLD